MDATADTRAARTWLVFGIVVGMLLMLLIEAVLPSFIRADCYPYRTLELFSDGAGKTYAVCASSAGPVIVPRMK